MYPLKWFVFVEKFPGFGVLHCTWHAYKMSVNCRIDVKMAKKYHNLMMIVYMIVI